MGKRMKKVFSLLLVFVMTLAININTSVFADSKGSVTVQIKQQGEVYINETVKIADLEAKLKSINSDHLYSTDLYTDYATKGIKTPTVADAMIYGYNQFYMGLGAEEVTPVLDTNYPNTEAAISYNWDLHPAKYNPGIYFIYFDGLTTANSNTVQNPDGSYTWTGDTWTLYVDGVKSELYASNVAIKDGTTITFEYAPVSETWK